MSLYSAGCLASLWKINYFWFMDNLARNVAAARDAPLVCLCLSCPGTRGGSRDGWRGLSRERGMLPGRQERAPQSAGCRGARARELQAAVGATAGEGDWGQVLPLGSRVTPDTCVTSLGHSRRRALHLTAWAEGQCRTRPHVPTLPSRQATHRPDSLIQNFPCFCSFRPRAAARGEGDPPCCPGAQHKQAARRTQARMPCVSETPVRRGLAGWRAGGASPGS